MKLQDKNTAKFTIDPNTGFLVTTAKLARTGAMEYLGDELGKKSGTVYDVIVDSEDLFTPETIKSFEGVPVTINHPEEMEVNASNWKELSVGHISNVRQDGEFLIGDVVVNDAQAIKTIQSGMIEVSCGYDADLVDSEDGTIKKQNIKGNHLAIVDEGRCGGKCKLGDGKPKTMKKTTFADNIRKKLGLKPKAKKVSFADSKVAIKTAKKKLNDAKAEFDAKLKDAEEVVVSETATVEEKAAAVQELQAEAATLMEEATTAVDEAQSATEQAEELAAQIEEEAPTEAPTNDADVVATAEEADSKIADLEAQLAEKDAKIAELEAELESLKEKESATSTMGDIKRVFPKVVLKDSMTSKDMKRAVLVATGAYNQTTVKTLTDCALDSAFAAAKTVASKPTNGIGKKFLGDSKPQRTKSAQQILGGK